MNIGLISNPLLVTFAWHGHLKNLAQSPWYAALYFIFRGS